MTEVNRQPDSDPRKPATKNSKFREKLHKILFFMLLLAVVLTVINQLGPSKRSITPISNKTYIELPDRKPLPVVTLEQAGKGHISTETFKGKWHLLLFGYTFCPDVCPVELTVLHQMTDILRQQLPPEQLPQSVFISIDPERDSPEKIAEYVTYFDADFIGMTGDQTELQILTMPLGISWMKELNSTSNSKIEDQNYLLSHTTTIILLNPEMKIAGLFPSPHSAEKMAQMYQKVLQNEAN